MANIDLLSFIEKQDFQGLQQLCAEHHPAVIAELLDELELEEADIILSHLDNGTCAEIFSHMSSEYQTALAELTSHHRLYKVLKVMDPDDRVDVIQNLPEARQQRLLHSFAREQREDIEHLSSYPEESAGSVMTTEFVTLLDDTLVEDAINVIRSQAHGTESIYYCYVVDKNNALLGVVSLKEIIIAPSKARIADIMQKNVVSIYVLEDQEEAARAIDRYGLASLPVVNEYQQMVGVVTYDDAMDILRQEATEDMEKFMAIGGSHESDAYLATSSVQHFKNRAPWILVLAILGLISGSILHSYEEALEVLIVLALYIPMVADTGGNTGSQAATLVVRALAVGEVRVKDTLRVLLKEFRVAFMLASALAFVTFGKVYFLSTELSVSMVAGLVAAAMLLTYAVARDYRVTLLVGIAIILVSMAKIYYFPETIELPEGYTMMMIGTVVALAMFFQAITATVIGASLPLLAKVFKFDPAVAASPTLTTIVDITGILIYFTVATQLLFS